VLELDVEKDDELVNEAAVDDELTEVSEDELDELELELKETKVELDE